MRVSYDLRVIEQVRVEQEYVLSFCFRACKPERIDIVGGVEYGIVDKLHVNAIAILLSDECLYHLMEVTSHDDKVVYSIAYQCVNATLQQAFLAHFE